MGDKEQDKVMKFDALFTTNHIQRLKILATYLDSSMQKNLSIYIKYLELQYTINFFRKSPSVTSNPLSHQPQTDLGTICDEMLPYCNTAERIHMENLSNMFKTMENYKEMMGTIQMMKDMFPEDENPLNSMFQSADMSSMTKILDLFQMQGGDMPNGNNK